MKQKTIQYAACLLMVLTLGAVGGGLLTSCSNDDDSSSSAPMKIDKIFLENINDEVNNDREVTFARLGQLIRIQGSGFKGLKRIYINGYETYFNNALMTDNNVWVTLNANTPVDKADESVRNTIRLVKDGTELVHAFIIRASSPSVTSVDNTLPKAGETVTVYGSNLQETTRVVLPGGVEITSGIASDEDGEWYSFTMPSGVTASGSITSEGANGTAVTPAYFNDFSCFITDFDGNGELGSWSATYSADDLVDDPLGTGRGKVAMLVPLVKLNAGGLDVGSNSLLWATAGNDNANDDWATRMTKVIPGNTPASNVAIQFDIYCPESWDLSGQLEISLQNNLSNYGYGSGCTKFSSQYMNTAAVWVPWFNKADGTHSAFTTGNRWQTVTIPLSTFGNYNPDTATSDADKATAAAADFLKVCTDRNSGSYRNFLFLFVNADLEDEGLGVKYPASLFTQKIYIDNLRVVNTTPVTVSDFNDEATEE